MDKRLILKISGEYLQGKNKLSTIDKDCLKNISSQIKELRNKGFEIGVVLGGGNILRGRNATSFGVDTANADYMGMFGTIINSIALKSSLLNLGVQVEILSLMNIKEEVLKKYSKRKANKLLKEGKVVIFAGGTGKIGFSTDTAAAQRAVDVKSKIILMGKNGTSGVYNKDPNKFKDAKMYKTLTYDKIIKENLKVMDLECARLCLDNKIVIRVFNIAEENAIIRTTGGESIGTLIKE
jgi:uridylate kinase